MVPSLRDNPNVRSVQLAGSGSEFELTVYLERWTRAEVRKITALLPTVYDALAAALPSVSLDVHVWEHAALPAASGAIVVHPDDVA